MQRKLLLAVFAVILAVSACSMVSAEIHFSTLTSTGTSQVLNLFCSDCPFDGFTRYDYALQNPVGNSVIIRAFTLQFPGVPVDDFVVTQTPAGWQAW